MLALLIYCYANGIFGNRRIERATYRDVSVRSLCAGEHHPDHDTICTFRRRNFEAVTGAFVDVLELARELRLLKLGYVSLASKLQRDVGELLAQAEAAHREDADPQKLPDESSGARKPKGGAFARRAAPEGAGKSPGAANCSRKWTVRARNSKRAPKAPSPSRRRTRPSPANKSTSPTPTRDSCERASGKATRKATTRRLLARPPTSLFPSAASVVDADGSQLIVGQRVSTCAADVGETEADLASIPASLGRPTAALADCGCADKEVIERLGSERPELDLYVSVHREDAHAERRYDWRPLDKIKAPKTLTDPVLVAMAEKLKTPEGKATYRRRASTVEPVFGVIKAALGFRQFLLRGLEKVSGEWNLVCLAYNLKRLHTLRSAAAVC